MLIISPYFPPVNGADMQRVRMSLPYFAQHGWEAEVVAVDPIYTDLPHDELLVESVPANIKIHWVKALYRNRTAPFGFGGIAYRAFWFYRQTVNAILKQQQFDLIYFSTTQFQLSILGAYWKKKFKVPYVIDMQDPWHTEYYNDKPKEQRPPKYWFSYRLNKYLEPVAIKKVDGLISVSKDYIDVLKERYPAIKQIPGSVITFGAFENDLKIAVSNESKFTPLLGIGGKTIVYVGRGGMDMHNAIRPFFEALKQHLQKDAGLSNTLKVYFIGTSYAPNGQGKPTILPLAEQYGLEKIVIEITGRIGYYHTLSTLQQADALFIPGSDNPSYTASKIYPYLLTNKPLLSIFNSKSSVVGILKEYGAAYNYTYDSTENVTGKIASFVTMVLTGKTGAVSYNKTAIQKYSAQNVTLQQCELFNKVVNE